MFGSDSKIAVGIALSAVLAPIGFLLMINFTFKPLSLIISGPSKSANLLAQVMDVLFYAPYSATLYLNTLDSPIYSINSLSSIYSPSVSRISYHLSPTSPQAS